MPGPNDIIRKIANVHVGNAIKHYNAIAQDPPDSNYKQLSPLGATEHIQLPSNDAILVAVADVSNSVVYEEVIAESLLRSIERYQGADAVSDGDWALIHARAIQSNADALADQLQVTNMALSSFNNAISSDPRDLDGVANDIESFSNSIETSGFSDGHVRILRNLGLSDSEINDVKAFIIGLDFSAFGGNGGIIKVNPATGEQTVISSGGFFVEPKDLTFDANGDIIVVDNSAMGGSVIKVNPAGDAGVPGSAQTLISSGDLFGVHGVGIAANGDIIVTSPFNAKVIKVNPSTGEKTLISSGGFLSPNPGNGLTIDPNGDIIVAERGNDMVVKVNPAGDAGVPGSAQTLISSGGLFGDPVSVTIYPDIPPSGPQVTYTPDLNFSGEDSFTFKVNDGFLDSNVATVSIDIVLPNAPVADDQSVVTSKDTPIDITLTGSDPDGAPLTFSIVTPPAHGTLSTVSSPISPLSGLISWWPGDGNIDDIVGGNDGTLKNGAAFGTGKVVQAFSLDGADDFVEVSDSDLWTFSDDFTIDFWVNLDSLASGSLVNPEVIFIGHDESPGLFVPKWFFARGAGMLFFHINGPGIPSDIVPGLGRHIAETAFSPTLGQWHHLAVTRSGDTYTIYVDGNPGTSESDTTVIPNSNTVLTIGKAESGSGLVNGFMDEVEIYDRALSPSEIHAVFNAGSVGKSKATIANSAQVTYTPDPNFNGDDSFTFKVNDGQVDSIPATVSITVNPVGVNNAPVADSQSVETNEDTPVAVTLTGSDIDGDSLTFSQVTGPANGQLVITGAVTCNGTAPSLCSVPATYIPNIDYNGPDSFEFKANDGNLDSNIATVSITVNPVDDAVIVINEPPQANDDTVSTDEDTAKDIAFADVLANDSDDDGDALSVTGVGAASHGSVSIIGETIRYVPDSNFNGMDSFTYDISDGHGGTATATVTVNVIAVNDAPILQPIDDQVIDEDATLSVSVSATDPDGTVPSLSVSGLPSFASFTDNGDGTGTINLAPGFNDAGTYPSVQIIASDGSLTDTKVFNIIVNDVNHNPIANDQSVSTEQNALVFIALTGSDPEGDKLTFSAVSDPASGSLLGSGSNIIYIPDLDFAGGDAFRFMVNDGKVDSNVATVSVTVNAGNNAPMFEIPPTPAGGTTFNINAGETLTFPIQCADPDAVDTVVFGSLTLPTDAFITPTIPTGNPAIGTFSWTPTSSQTVTITFICTDDHGVFVQHSISVVVNPAPAVNHAPVADNQDVSTDEDNAIGITLTASDADGDTIAFSVVSEPSHGTLSGTAPNLLYQPHTNYNGPDSFTFKTNDGKVDSNIATVSITVNPLNDTPDAVDDTGTTPEDTPVVIDVLDNDSDIDGDILTVTSVTTPAHGTAIINTDGTITYTPFANYNGPDSLDYTISDGNGGSDKATVSISVNPVNDAPSFDVPPTPPVGTTFNINRGQTLTFPVQCSDPDATDTVTVGNLGLPAGATLTPATGNPATSTFDWTPTSAQTTGITFTCTDSNGSSVQHAISIVVTQPPNTPGKITAGGAQVDKNTNFGFNVQSDGVSIKGELEYQDRSANINLHSIEMISLNITPDKTKGTFSGTATVNGKSGYTFVIEVEDNGEPGNKDEFKITIPELNYAKGGTLMKGNIQIHK